MTGVEDVRKGMRREGAREVSAFGSQRNEFRVTGGGRAERSSMRTLAIC